MGVFGSGTGTVGARTLDVGIGGVGIMGIGPATVGIRGVAAVKTGGVDVRAVGGVGRVTTGVGGVTIGVCTSGTAWVFVITVGELVEVSILVATPCANEAVEAVATAVTWSVEL